jgi:hypothetical protein
MWRRRDAAIEYVDRKRRLDDGVGLPTETLAWDVVKPG